MVYYTLMTLIPPQLKRVDPVGPSSSYAPDPWQRRALLGMVGMILLTFMASNIWALLWQTSDWLVATILPGVVVDLTNTERRQQAAPSLARSDLLDRAAQLKAEHMAREGYFAHYSPSGVTPWHWFGEVGYEFVHAGENLAVHFNDTRALVQAWMDSPTHRANIVNGQFTEIGVGTARGRYQGFDTVFVVQLFGTPAAAQPPPRVTTPSLPAETTATAREMPDTSSLAESESATETALVMNTETNEVVAEDEEVIVMAEPAETESPPLYDEVREEPIFLARLTGEETEMAVAPVTTTEEPVAGETWQTGVHTTSTDRIPATMTVIAQSERQTPALVGLATQPNSLLQLTYIFLSVIVLLMIVRSLQIEVRRRRYVQMAYSYGMLLVMAGLMYVHLEVTSWVLIA